VADAGRGVQVGSERRLTVRSRPHEVEPPARAEDSGAEAGYEVSAFVFEGHRWHRDEDIIRQKGSANLLLHQFSARQRLQNE
jgi:hypothetical protein